MATKNNIHNIEERYKILKKQKSKCAICGKTLDINTMTIDHYIPLSKEGRDVDRNLFITCVDCNKAKGNKIYKPKKIYKYSSESKLENARLEYDLWSRYNLKTVQKRTKFIFVYKNDTLIEIPFDRNLYLYDKKHLIIVKRLENVYKVPNIDLINEMITIPINHIEVNEPLHIKDIDTTILLVTDKSKLDEYRKEIIKYHNKAERS